MILPFLSNAFRQLSHLRPSGRRPGPSWSHCVRSLPPPHHPRGDRPGFFSGRPALPHVSSPLVIDSTAPRVLREPSVSRLRAFSHLPFSPLSSPDSKLRSRLTIPQARHGLQPFPPVWVLFAHSIRTFLWGTSHPPDPHPLPPCGDIYAPLPAAPSLFAPTFPPTTSASLPLRPLFEAVVENLPAPADLIVTMHSNFVGSFCKVRRRLP
jgi:hypothetical protein